MHLQRSKLRASLGLPEELATGAYTGRVASRRELAAASGDSASDSEEEGSDGGEGEGEDLAATPSGSGTESDSSVSAEDGEGAPEDDVDAQLAALAEEDAHSSFVLKKESKDLQQAVHVKNQLVSPLHSVQS